MILALSKSGETRELADIIAYAKRFDIPLIAHDRRAGQRRWAAPPTSCCCCPTRPRPPTR